jgi:simple sugar transport system ATP-binding protein
MVHQHFMLVPVFTVAENVMLGVESTTGPLGVLDMPTVRKRIREISDRHNLRVDPDALVEDLPVGVRQRVEIIKTLYRQSHVLILDEPTAVLTPQEGDELFGIMRSLVAGGTSIIFITHKLNEVLKVADRISVLRRGRVVGNATPDETTPEKLATMMVGREVDLVVDKTPAKPGQPELEIRGLHVRDDRGQLSVNNVDLTVRAGEIMAVAGVQGNGQSELAEAITGLRSVELGEILIGGQKVHLDPRSVYRESVAHVPEDRLEEGLVPAFNVAENLALNSYWAPPFGHGLSLDRDEMAKVAEVRIKEFDIRTPSVFNPVANLSGGNQQKVIIARELSRPLKLVVAVQPTRGLDVGSIEYIHRRPVQKRDEGSAVLLISTELDEVTALGDRIAVMYQGKIVSILTPEEASFEKLGLLMGGANPEEHSAEEVVEMAGKAG